MHLMVQFWNLLKKVGRQKSTQYERRHSKAWKKSMSSRIIVLPNFIDFDKSVEIKLYNVMISFHRY